MKRTTKLGRAEVIAAVAAVSPPTSAPAGAFGSLAAVPQQTPGWSFASIYYHTSISAGGDLALAREIETGRAPVNLTATLNANLNSTADLGFFSASYALQHRCWAVKPLRACWEFMAPIPLRYQDY